MIIPTEKQVPPAYAPSPTVPPPFHLHRIVPKLDALPANVLLYILNSLFPTNTNAVDAPVRRKILYWMAMSLRLVSKGFYIASMHILRSVYLPSYTQLVKPPYSSDPFPGVAPSEQTSPVLTACNRETRVLDLYIAVKVREDVWIDDSDLHLERDESFKDLFDLMQPRSRTEDLVAQYGVEKGLITVFGGNKKSPVPIPFSSLAVSFSPRSLGLVLSSKTQKRTLVECHRERGERLEIGAKRLIKELERWSWAG